MPKISFKHRVSALLACVVLISACAPHTVNYDPTPQLIIPETFPSYVRNQDTNKNLTGPWWESFDRSDLTSMIETALSANQDVEASYAAVRRARAVSRETRANIFPEISLEGDTQQTWRGNDTQRGTAEIGAALDWELDIWGRIGSATRADSYEADARLFDAQGVKLSVSAEVANAYFGAAAAQEQLELLKEQVKLDRELLDLLQLRLDKGIGTSVDVLQQKARVADSETLIPLSIADRDVFENRLDVLLGQVPDGKPRLSKSENLDFAKTLPELGIPTALLLNRPDLKSARAELIAADADIASAIANRLPKVTLDASYVRTDTLAYTGPLSLLMAAFVQPLLDWGERKAQVEENQALYEERLANFTQAFLEAVEEVENNIIQETRQREFLKRLKAQRDILRQTAEETEALYTRGVDDYLPVINALQELRSVERNLITQRLELVNIRIALFRAIGGPINGPITSKDQ